jgi:mono/diheme cytochrome c family protein
MRLQRRWVERFLLEPHDLRPNLPAMMPRLALSPAEAAILASHLVPRPATDPLPTTADRQLFENGRELFMRSGCGTCHRFSGAEALPARPLPDSVMAHLSPAQLAMGLALAPDLRHTRERFQPAALIPWLRAPSQLKPDTAMPTFPLTDSEAAALAHYVFTAPLQPETAAPLPSRLPLLTRRVTWDEVNERVFRRTCWHCHSTPEFAMGDGGPGNSGGFGFKGRGLNISSYTDLASGSLDDGGKRRSVFLPLKDGTPRLVAHLMARHAEVAGRPMAGIRGMPLGLVPLSMEQINLVESWIAQGRPR